MLAALLLWEIWKAGTVCRGRAKVIHSSSEERASNQLVQMVRRAAKLSERGGLPGGCRGHLEGWTKKLEPTGDGVDYARSPPADALATGLTDAVGRGLRGAAAAQRDEQRAHELNRLEIDWSAASLAAAGTGRHWQAWHGSPEVISLPTTTAPRLRHEALSS